MLPRTTPPGPFPIQYAFVVQCAADTPTGRVEHLVLGHVLEFRSVAALRTFMAARLQAVQHLSTAEHATENHLQD